MKLSDETIALMNAALATVDPAEKESAMQPRLLAAVIDAVRPVDGPAEKVMRVVRRRRDGELAPLSILSVTRDRDGSCTIELQR